MAIFRLEAIVDVLTGKAVKELDNLEARGKKSAQAMENLQKRIDRAGYAAEQKSAKIAELRKVVEAGGAGAEKAAKQIEKLEKSMFLSGQRTDRLKSELANLQQVTAKSGGQMDKFAASALRLAGPAVLGALSVVLVKLATDAIKFGLDVDAAMARFRAATGASATESKRFEHALLELHQNGTQSVEEIADALRVIRREFGDLGSQLVPVTQAVLEFAKATGQDAATGIDQVKDVLDGFNLGVEAAGPVMDRLTRASQLSGANVGELATALSQGATVFQAFGLSADESLSILTHFADQGINAEKATQGLARVMDAAAAGGDKNAAAFRSLGIEVDALGRPIGGANAALQRMFQAFSDGQSSQQEFSALVDLVGNKLAGQFSRALEKGSDAVKGINDELANSVGAAHNAAQAIGEGFFERFERFKREHFDPGTSAMGSAFVTVGKFAIDVMDAILKAIGAVGQFLGQLAWSLQEQFTSIYQGLEDLFVGLVQLVKDVLADLLTALAGTLDQLPDMVKEKLGTTQQSLLVTVAALREGGQGARDKGQGAFSRIAGGIGNLIAGKPLTDAFSNTVESAYSSPQPVLPTLKSDDSGLKKKPEKTSSGDGEAAKEAARKATDDALKDLEFYVSKRKALNDLSTSQELELLEKVQTTRKYGQTQLVLDKDQERKLELDIANLKGKLLDEVEKKRKEADEKAEKAAVERAKLESDLAIEIIRQTQGETAAKIAELDRQKAEYLKVATDKVQVEEWYQGQRKQIEDDANKDILAKRQDLTKQLQDATLQAEGKEVEIKVRAIEETVQKARAADVDEQTIAEFVAAKKKELLDAEKAAVQGTVDAEKQARASLLGQGGFTTGNVYGSVAEAFADQGNGNASAGPFSSKPTAKKKNGDLTASQANDRLGALTGGTGGTPPIVPDLAGGATAALGKATKSASFGAGSESLLSSKNSPAAPKPAGQTINLAGELKVTGQLTTSDGDLADIQGTLDPSGLDARLMGDNPSIPGL